MDGVRNPKQSKILKTQDLVPDEEINLEITLNDVSTKKLEVGVNNIQVCITIHLQLKYEVSVIIISFDE